MKGLKTKALAMLLVLALAAMPVSAFAAGEGETSIGGDMGSEQYAVNVVIPIDLDYYVNRLSHQSGINQITNIDFPVINKSGVPVAVDVTVSTVDTTDDNDPDTVTLVDDLDDLEQDFNQPNSKDKKVLFGILGASGAGEDSIAFDTDMATEGDFFAYAFDEVDADVADVIASDTFRMFTQGEDDANASIQIILDAATGDDDVMATQSVLAADDAGISSFTFFAALNTFADWEANDLDVAGEYVITALNRVKNYVPLSEQFIDDGLNIMPASASNGGSGDDEFEFPDGAVIMLAGDEAENDDILKSENPTGYTVYLSNVTDVPKAVTGITRNGSTFATTNYSYNATTGALVITGMPSSTSTMIATATLEDDSTATFTWQVVA